MLTVFGIFFILLYFPHSNSNIETQIDLIVSQACLCHDKEFEVNVFCLCLRIFYFCSCKNSVLKTIVDLTEIWDAFLTL